MAVRTITQKSFMDGFHIVAEIAYDMPPLIFDEVARVVYLIDEEIRDWKAGLAEKPSWGFFCRLLEEILERGGVDSPWKKA
jgi:hypothetical protein